MRKENERTKQKRQAIEACRDKFGRIIPRLIWQTAKKSPKHVLHREFNWNLQEAAEAHWEERAKELIREVKLKVVMGDQTIVAPYYVSDPSREDSAYVTTISVAKESDVAEMVMLDELRRCELAVVRARSVASALGLLSDLERLLEGIIEIRRRVRPDGPPENRPHL